MTQPELTRFRGVLETQQAELENLLRSREGIACDSAADMLDQIQNTLERDLAIGNLERESTLLRQVQGALRRIHAGTFGICLDCEEEISQKRLTAVPWAARCLTCCAAVDGRRMLPRKMMEAPQLDSA